MMQSLLMGLLRDVCAVLCRAVVGSQVKLDGPQCEYEGLMEAKRRIARQIFDAAGHKSLETPAYKVGSSSAGLLVVGCVAVCLRLCTAPGSACDIGSQAADHAA